MLHPSLGWRGSLLHISQARGPWQRTKQEDRGREAARRGSRRAAVELSQALAEFDTVGTRACGGRCAAGCGKAGAKMLSSKSASP